MHHTKNRSKIRNFNGAEGAKFAKAFELGGDSKVKGPKAADRGDSLCVILNVLAASVTLINPLQAASELCARFHVLFDGFV